MSENSQCVMDKDYLGLVANQWQVNNISAYMYTACTFSTLCRSIQCDKFDLYF